MPCVVSVMASLYLLIPLSLLMVGLACGLVIWAIRSGQFDGLDNRMPDEDQDPAND